MRLSWALAILMAAACVEKSRLTPAEIGKDAIRSVVLIRTSIGMGSGFVVKEDGLIATNHHVIYPATDAVVVLSDGKEIADVSVVAVDEPHDLALLRVPAENLHPLALADPKEIEPGDRVVAIGHPAGLGNTVTDGLVSALRTISPELTLLQISAPISPGSSGGPLIAESGRVIGMSTLYSIKGQNLNFGVPVEYLTRLIAAGGPPTPLAKYDWAPAKLGVERDIPRHEADLLADCSIEDLAGLVRGINGAIDVGAPLYNDGHHEACFRIYQGAALDLQKSVAGCSGGKKALAEGVRRAAEAQGYDRKAWAMRDTFDGILEVVARRSARTRHVPNHELTLVNDCTREELAVVEDAIVSAIDIGAPLYNQGNIEACFRVYEGAILNLTRSERKGCAGPKEALREGLDRARSEKTYDDKAWALRDSFDGVLDVIGRKVGRP